MNLHEASAVTKSPIIFAFHAYWYDVEVVYTSYVAHYFVVLSARLCFIDKWNNIKFEICGFWSKFKKKTIKDEQKQWNKSCDVYKFSFHKHSKIQVIKII